MGKGFEAILIRSAKRYVNSYTTLFISSRTTNCITAQQSRRTEDDQTHLTDTMPSVLSLIVHKQSTSTTPPSPRPPSKLDQNSTSLRRSLISRRMSRHSLCEKHGRIQSRLNNPGLKTRHSSTATYSAGRK